MDAPSSVGIEKTTKLKETAVTVPTRRRRPFAIMPRNKTSKKRSHQTYLEMPQAIFIHAGAGFHSVQNEKIHLSVCSKWVQKIPTALEND